MNLRIYLDQFDEQLARADWYSFVGFIDSIHAELTTLSPSTADRQELLSAQEILLYRYIEDSNRQLFPRLIAAELIALLGIDLDSISRMATRLLGRTRNLGDSNFIVVSSLSAHLLGALETPSRVDQIFGRQGHTIVSGLAEAVQVRESSFTLNALGSPTAQVAPDIRAITTLPGLLPGDCIFRRQTVPWHGINPFRDFGHAGIYVGQVDSSLDPNDCNSHVVVHVVSAKPACQLTTLHEFCNPHGHAEQFWGAFQVDLTDAERNMLIAKAFSFANQCSYSFTSGYKDGKAKTFRCDGFVEFCHEAVKPSQNPLNYRGGLFEDDNWKTLNPRAMSNCLIRRATKEIGSCCTNSTP